ncbi:MAG: acyl-CoA thioesterase [Lachnospiraceae bacterium]|nr:acyl-CoA thioesterase [Lachnospiraceae bacterium]
MEPYTRTIYYYETDRMSIVHNSNYLRLFEEARLDHLKKCGVDYLEIEGAGILIPQVEAYVKYIKPLQYGCSVRIRVKLTGFNGIIMKYEYSLFNGNDIDPSATGTTSHCFLDEKKRLPLSIKKRMPDVYEKMKTALFAQ